MTKNEYMTKAGRIEKFLKEKVNELECTTMNITNSKTSETITAKVINDIVILYSNNWTDGLDPFFMKDEVLEKVHLFFFGRDRIITSGKQRVVRYMPPKTTLEFKVM